MARRVAGGWAVTFRQPRVQPLDLGGIEYRLDLSRGRLHRAPVVRMSLRPGRFALRVASREDFLQLGKLLARQPKLDAELSQHIVMVAEDVGGDGIRMDRTGDVGVGPTSCAARERGGDEQDGWVRNGSKRECFHGCPLSVQCSRPVWPA